MAVALLPLQLRFYFTHSNPKFHPLTPVPRLKVTPDAQLQVFSSAATVAGKSGYGVVVGGMPLSDYQDEDPIQLPPELQREFMPKHVAVIMDGNRRWARMRGLPVVLSYEAGVRSLMKIIELSCKWGISVLTVFAFSSDNWLRPKVEVDLLMGLFDRVLRNELQHFMRGKVRISLIGDSSKLPKPLQALLADAVVTTQSNSRLHLILAINYSGQTDFVQACQNIAIKVKDGLIEPEDVNKLLVEKELQTNCTDYPCPDLLVRTSGELRISNFLLWQLAYTELYFSHSLWPDFGEDEFLEALCCFQKRQRRYGGERS